MGLLKPEPPDQTEFNGLVQSGTKRLKDASNKAISDEGRFDLAYNAAHALALTAMRWHGFRPDNKRYIVFQALEHTLGLSAAQRPNAKAILKSTSKDHRNCPREVETHLNLFCRQRSNAKPPSVALQLVYKD
jgi:hypothetical protein